MCIRDRLESEGLSARFVALSVKAFAGPEEPEESDDEEVNGVVVHLAEDGTAATGVAQFPKDADVDGVGALLGVVFSTHAFEESIE